jgi:hypothetical protein
MTANSQRMLAIAAILSAPTFVARPAAAVETGHMSESSYTVLNLESCRHLESSADEDYGSWSCKGYRGIPVFVMAGDQRSYISYGLNAKSEPAAKQTLAAFNSEGKTIEWRLDRSNSGAMKPFATIVCWNTTVSSGAEAVRGQVLVVTRLAPGAVCHVGYVDALANADAGVLARKIADENARNYRCGTDKPIILGNTGPGFSRPYGD